MKLNSLLKRVTVKANAEVIHLDFAHTKMNCFIIVGECGALVREKMAKYGVDASALQCFSQTRGKKKDYSRQ